MKNNRLIYFFALLLAIAGVSCSKSDNASSSASNRWTINEKVYIATGISLQKTAPYALTAYDNNTNSNVYIFFKTIPTQSGTYKIKDGANNDDELYIVSTVVEGTESTTYRSTGFDNITATVTVSGETISITVPSVWLSTLTSGGADVRFTCSLKL